MGVLPAGASSVFARHLGFPRDTVAAGGMLAEAIRQESTRAVGLGVADERRFTFAAGLGLDAEATAAVDRLREERSSHERPGDLKVVQAALGILREEGFALHERMTIRTDRGSFHRASYVAVANQHPYTFFGRVPVKAAPRADFEHGLDVVFTRELRRRDLWRLPVYGLLWPRHAQPRLAPGRLPPRPGRLLGDVRRPDRHPDRRGVPRRGRAGALLATSATRSGCSCRPATTADAAV